MKRGLPGDINGDGEVNAKDLIRLRKYFSGWEVEVDEVALDVNGDGEINAKDLIRLRKYFAGWNVEIFYGVSPSVCAHSLNKVAAVAATCTAKGNDEYYVCEKCNKIFADETAKTELSAAPIIEAKGHVEQILEAVAPTCTQTGLTAGKICAVCNTVLVEQEVIKATGHTEVIDEAVEPTCTNTGLTQGKRCSVCGTVLVEQEVIPCHKYGAWSWSVEPTEKTKGVIKRSCSDCGTTQTKEVPALYVLDKNGNQTIEVNSVYTYSRDGESCTASGRTDLFNITVDGSVLTIEKVVKTNHYIVVNNVAKYIKAGQLCVDSDYDYKIEAFDDITCNAAGVEGFFTCDECNKKVKVYVRSEHIAFDEKFQVGEDKEKSVAPTCTAAGVKYYHCGNCGSEVCVTVPALGHDVVCAKVHEPTDNNSNWVFDLMCRTCNETLDSAVSEKAPTIMEVAATCTENAYIVYTDIVIGKNADGTDKILLDYNGYPVKTRVEKAGTALGHYNGVLGRAVRDNEVFDMRDEINAQAFTSIGGLSCADSSKENPSDGVYTCDVCHNTFLVKIYMSHKGEIKTDKYATCTESGEYTIIKCDDCKATNIKYEVPALGHNKVYTIAKTDSDIVATWKCDRVNLSIVADPTEVDPDHTKVVETACDAADAVQKTVKSYAIIIKSTCKDYGKARLTYEDGSTEDVMLERCGHILNGKEMVLADVDNKVFYDYRLAGVELTVDESEITCDEDKLASLTCANAMFRCDVCNKARQIFVKKEHVYQNGSCIGCGCEIKYSENLSFTLNSDGASYSVSKGSCTDTEINIPPVYNSLPVTSIGEHAFDGCNKLTNIIIPNSVTIIGFAAFIDCGGLIGITIPNSVTSISALAFSGCSGLEEINVTSGNTKYYSENNCLIEAKTKTLISGCKNSVISNDVMRIGDWSFSGCSGLISITIGNGVTSIGGWAFSGCSGLEEIKVASGNTKYYSENNCLIETETKTLILGCKNSVIPNDVTKIGDWGAFCGCNGLTSITIPDSVTSIGECAFSGCSGLTGVAIGNSVTSIGGSAFSFCSELTSVTISDSVTSIGDDAFLYCSRLTSVTIPDSVTSIGDGAFLYCNGLTNVTIGNGVTSIGYYAFSSCSGLKTIKFVGTCKQWAAVTKNSGWNDGVPATKVICNDGEVDL